MELVSKALIRFDTLSPSGLRSVTECFGSFTACGSNRNAVSGFSCLSSVCSLMGMAGTLVNQGMLITSGCLAGKRENMVASTVMFGFSHVVFCLMTLHEKLCGQQVAPSLQHTPWKHKRNKCLFHVFSRLLRVPTFRCVQKGHFHISTFSPRQINLPSWMPYFSQVHPMELEFRVA